MKTQVTQKAVEKRVRRRLARNGEVLNKTRGTDSHAMRYHIVSGCRTGHVTGGFDDLEDYAREQGVLAEHEAMGD